MEFVAQVNEKFVEYSSNSSVPGWRGWLENDDGECTGFVDTNNNVFRQNSDGVFVRNAAYGGETD